VIEERNSPKIHREVLLQEASLVADAWRAMGRDRVSRGRRMVSFHFFASSSLYLPCDGDGTLFSHLHVEIGGGDLQAT
jgi:hypothetical protein